MKKDIEFPEVKDVGIAIVPEFEDGGSTWVAYFINFRKNNLQNVMISSSGYGEIDGRKKETTILRYFFDEIQGLSFKKLEIMLEDSFKLTNQFWVSFYESNVLYEKKFIFVQESINETNMVLIPVIQKKGIIIR